MNALHVTHKLLINVFLFITIVLSLTSPPYLRSQEKTRSGEPDRIGETMLEYVKGIEVVKEGGRRHFIKDKLNEFGVPFSVIPFETSITYNGKTTRFFGENIVVSKGNGRGKIVVGAHLDAVYGAPGANDNGSGVAVLLQLIRDLDKRQFNHRIDFCFFDHEEPGLIGSSIYVREFDTIYSSVAMINLDVEGTGNEIYVGPTQGKHHSTILKYVHQARKKFKYTYYEDEVIPETDNESFDDAGMENISISVVPSGDGKKISDLCRDPLNSKERDENYPRVLNVMHTVKDTSELVEPEALTMAYEFAVEMLILIDNGEK
jgi:hypothetical protein